MEIARHWRLKQQRYSLMGGTCPHCDHKMFPPRRICPNCGQPMTAQPEREAANKRSVVTYEYKAEPSPVAQG